MLRVDTTAWCKWAHSNGALPIIAEAVEYVGTGKLGKVRVAGAWTDLSGLEGGQSPMSSSATIMQPVAEFLDFSAMRKEFRTCRKTLDKQISQYKLAHTDGFRKDVGGSFNSLLCTGEQEHAKGVVTDQSGAVAVGAELVLVETRTST